MADFSLEPGEELDSALRRAAFYLDAAGIDSAAADAQLLAAYLLEKETITGAEFMDILEKDDAEKQQ